MSELRNRLEQLQTCKHEQSEIRRKTVSRTGVPMYARQCLACGQQVGQWVKLAEIPDPAGAKPWDGELAESEFSIASAVREEARRTQLSRTSEWWGNYKLYLNSPTWQSKRERVLIRDKYQCQACCRAKATQVHHLTYANVDFKGGEPLFELVSVCEPCHQRLHGKRPAFFTGKEIIAQLESLDRTPREWEAA